MPSFARVWRTGSRDCSTSRMISNFSAAGYLIRRPPQPRSLFFQSVLEHLLGTDLFQRAGLPAQLLDLIRGCRPCRVASHAPLAGPHNFLRPAVIEVLDDPFAAAQCGVAPASPACGYRLPSGLRSGSARHAGSALPRSSITKSPLSRPLSAPSDPAAVGHAVRS